MNEQITSAAELDALRRAAQRFIVAYDRMVEINQGIGGLAVHEPRLYEDFIAWNHASDYYHADTVLALFAQQPTVGEVKAEAWDEGHRHAWRRGPDECMCSAWSSNECACGRYGSGELLSLADNPYREARP